MDDWEPWTAGVHLKFMNILSYFGLQDSIQINPIPHLFTIWNQIMAQSHIVPVDEGLALWLARGQATRHNTEGRRPESWRVRVCASVWGGNIHYTIRGSRRIGYVGFCVWMRSWSTKQNCSPIATSQARTVYTHKQPHTRMSSHSNSKQTVRACGDPTPAREKEKPRQRSKKQTLKKERKWEQRWGRQEGTEGDSAAEECSTSYSLTVKKHQTHNRNYYHTHPAAHNRFLTGLHLQPQLVFVLWNRSSSRLPEKTGNNLIPPVSHGSPLKFHHGGQSPSAQWPHRLQAPTKAPFHLPQSEKRAKQQSTCRSHQSGGYWGSAAFKVHQGWRRSHPHMKRTLAFSCLVGRRYLWPLGLLAFFLHPAGVKVAAG